MDHARMRSPLQSSRRTGRISFLGTRVALYTQGAGVLETGVAHGWPVIFFRWPHERVRVGIYVWHPSAFKQDHAALTYDACMHCAEHSLRNNTWHAFALMLLPCHAASLSSGQQMEFDGVRECRNKSLRRRRVGSNALQKQISPELIPCPWVSYGIAKDV